MIQNLIVAFAFLFTDFTTAIKDYNLTKLWRADTFQAEGDGDIFPFPEPLGYIGDNYQHFFIHYITVTKSESNPYQYIVYGKTKVKDNICSFTGTITVKKATIEKSIDSPGYREGLVTCDVLFYEDSTHAGSGVIKGQLVSGFSLDKKGKFQYDALMFMGDGFANNSCKATWTSYKIGKSKKRIRNGSSWPDAGNPIFSFHVQSEKYFLHTPSGNTLPSVVLPQILFFLLYHPLPAHPVVWRSSFH